MPDERGGRALTFSTRYGDGLGTVNLQEYVGLRCDCVKTAQTFKFHGRYARRFDDEVERPVFCFGLIQGSIYFLIVAGYDNFAVRHKLLQQ